MLEHFHPDVAFTSPIVYTSEIDGKAKRVSENLTFDGEGRVTSAEVFHGVTG